MGKSMMASCFRLTINFNEPTTNSCAFRTVVSPSDIFDQGTVEIEFDLKKR